MSTLILIKERRNDVIPTAHEGFKAGDDVAKRSDPLHVLVGPITRQRAKKIKEAMVGLANTRWPSVISRLQEHTYIIWAL